MRGRSRKFTSALKITSGSGRYSPDAPSDDDAKSGTSLWECRMQRCAVRGKERAEPAACPLNFPHRQAQGGQVPVAQVRDWRDHAMRRGMPADILAKWAVRARCGGARIDATAPG